MRVTLSLTTLISLFLANFAYVRADPPATTQSVALGKLPHISVDVSQRQVRVDCTMLGIDTPLEFFCVLKGTNEHESVLRTEALPSHIHFALLMLGLEPGEPVHYVQASKRWIPPDGKPVNISVEFMKEGKLVTLPASALIRDIHTKRQQPPHSWIFTGSKLSPDGAYAADITGYLVSVVNFDLTTIDIPDLASSANETLEWEINKAAAPVLGSAVTMIIAPAESAKIAAAAPAMQPTMEPAMQPTSQPASDIDLPVIKIREDGALSLNDRPMTRAQIVDQFKQSKPMNGVRIASVPRQRDLAVAIADDLRGMNVSIESAAVATNTSTSSPFDLGDAAHSPPSAQPPTSVNDAVKHWQETVASHKQELQQAAAAHAAIVADLRKQQQALLGQADALQRVIDELEKQYQDLTIAPAPPQSEQPQSASPDR